MWLYCRSRRGAFLTPWKVSFVCLLFGFFCCVAHVCGLSEPLSLVAAAGLCCRRFGRGFYFSAMTIKVPKFHLLARVVCVGVC